MQENTVLRFILIVMISSSCHAADCPGLGGHLNGENIDSYAGCSRVMGNIIIDEGSFQSIPSLGMDESLTVEELSVLSGVREVDGYVQIENTNHEHLTNLRFLRNLETIRGQETLEMFPAQYYSLSISGNHHLQTLNLASLKRIENGGVRITSNPQLCLVDTISIEDYLTASSASRVGDYAQDCSGVTCHAQCEMSRGCWGTLADECVQCRSYQYQGICVDTCNESISYADDETMSCIPLPTSTSDRVTTGKGDEQHYTPSPALTDSTNKNTDEELGVDNVTVTPEVKLEATNTSIPDSTSLSIYLVTPSLLFLIIPSILLAVLLIVAAYKRIKKRKMSRALKEGGKLNAHIKDTKVILVGANETASQPILKGRRSLEQGALNRRQHVCSRLEASEKMYDSEQDAASPEPEVVIMVDVDSNMDTNCDDERYTSMPSKHCHVTTLLTSCDDHVIDPASPLNNTIGPQSFYESVLTQSMTPQSPYISPMKQNSNPRSHSQIQNTRSAFQHSLMTGGVYSTGMTLSRHSTGSNAFTVHSHRSSLPASSTSRSGVTQRTSGRESRSSHYGRLSTAGRSIVANSRAGTSTQGSLGSGILPTQE